MRKTIFLIALLIAMCFILTACGGFTSWGDADKIIEDIKGVTLDGIDYMAIYYADETEPTLIPLPKGVDGTSVNIDSHYDKDNRKTIVTVSFSNGATPEVFEVKDGESITKASIENELGKDFVVFWCGPEVVGSFPLDDIKGKDGATWLNGITAPADSIGKNGDFFLDTVKFDVYIKKSDTWEPVGNLTGVGIDKIETYESAEGNGVRISYTDPTWEPTIVLCPGIVDIDLELDGDSFVFVVTLSNGIVDENGVTQTTQKSFPISRFPKWDSGIDYPSNEDGIVGDFYFYEPTQTIMQKKESGWTTVISFSEILNQENKTVTITFNSLGGKMTIPGFINPTSEYTMETAKGSFVNASSIPIPTKEGYTFAGWYTVPAPNPLINGMFTDMVPVSQNITLYAYWIANSTQP